MQFRILRVHTKSGNIWTIFVPTNLIEHNLIVARLVSAGSLPAEAEQTIASRKAAYNKALREYKKENPSNQSSGRPTRQSKLSKNNSSQNAN